MSALTENNLEVVNINSVPVGSDSIAAVGTSITNAINNLDNKITINFVSVDSNNNPLGTVDINVLDTVDIDT